MRNVECVVCGAPFQTTHWQKKTCSTGCQQEWQRVRVARNYASNHERINRKRREDYAENPDRILEQNRRWREQNRSKINGSRRAWWTFCNEDRIEEAQALRPILDQLEFTPENREKIEIMADYIETDPYLVHALDWYWLADALIFLERSH